MHQMFFQLHIYRYILLYFDYLVLLFFHFFELNQMGAKDNLNREVQLIYLDS